ncbi:glycerate kinase [bacterium]|nr:glycerate kinase [bacterium]
MKNRQYHFLLAPDSFKDSLSAPEICDAMARGIRRTCPDARITSVPLSDGGEGFTRALTAAGGECRRFKVMGPLGESVHAHYGLIDKNRKTGVVEMAAASGLHLIPVSRRNPLNTTTFGTGELIRKVLNHDVDQLIIGIGGSATHDLGCGLAQALGVRFYDSSGEISRPICGGLLETVRAVEIQGLNIRLKAVEIMTASDVKNPLLGPQGAAYTYARQKGADDQIIETLEKGSGHIIRLIEEATGKSVRDVPGAGAAGGLGAGIMAFLGSAITPGIELILDRIGFDELLNGVDYILTGEGKTDAQTIQGKTVWGVIQRAKKQSVPVIVLSGRVESGARILYNHGVQIMDSICPKRVTEEDALKNTRSDMIRKVAQVVRKLVLA